MLQKIRENSQGWIAWVIVGLIIITFALFGIDQYAQSEKTVIVAEVNGEDITGSEFLTLYNQQKQRLQSQFGDMYEQVVDDETLRAKVLDALIESKVIQQYSESNNMSVSNEQLSAVIQSSSVFQKEGVFDEETYQQILLRNGLSVAKYEYEQKKFMQESQYKGLTSASVFSTDTQVKDLVKLQFQERKFNYLRVDQRHFLKTIELDDAEISEYYKQNKADYVVPEKVTVDYLLLSQEDIAKKIEINDDDLENYYQENKDQFVFAEQREASHILVRVDHPSQDEAALKKIVEIQDKIKAGEDFGKLAKTLSDDPGSASLNGDLGKFKQGMMVPEFDDAVFSLKEGEVSEPVKTDFGYHLIKLTKIHPKYIKDYDEVKGEVKDSYRQLEAEKIYFDLLEQLTTLTYEQPDTLDSASEALGIDVKTTEPFSKSGGVGAIASNTKVVAASFSEEVKNNRVNSSLIEISPTSSVVVRINAVIPESQKELAEVKLEIEKELKRQKAVQASADLATQILAKVNAGEDFKSLSREGVEYKTEGWAKRGTNEVLPMLKQAVFKAAKPTKDKPSYVIAKLALGDSMVVEVVGVKDGIAESEEVTEQIKNTVELIQSGVELSIRIGSILENTDIKKREVYKTLK